MNIFGIWVHYTNSNQNLEKNLDKDTENKLYILRQLNKNPEISQRYLAQSIRASLGNNIEYLLFFALYRAVVDHHVDRLDVEAQ